MESHSSEAVGSARGWAPTACLAGAVVGVVLIVVGAVWRTATTPATFWSAEQAAEFKAASDALHDASHDHRGVDHEHVASEEAGDNGASARARFERIQAQLERAQYARDGVGPLLMQIGLAAAIAFGIGYLASRGE